MTHYKWQRLIREKITVTKINFLTEILINNNYSLKKLKMSIMGVSQVNWMWLLASSKKVIPICFKNCSTESLAAKLCHFSRMSVLVSGTKFKTREELALSNQIVTQLTFWFSQIRSFYWTELWRFVKLTAKLLTKCPKDRLQQIEESKLSILTKKLTEPTACLYQQELV